MPPKRLDLELKTIVVHGHRRAYRICGEGPAILLLHGLGCDSSTWLPVLPALAEQYTVIAPDLLGHGASDKPRADYTLGGYANGMRDLLTLLGIDRATVVGHSLGGGVAMQFAYQFPERTERLCMIAPGGLGSEVTGLLRALTLPGAGLVVSALSLAPLRPIIRRSLIALSRTGIGALRDLDEVAGVYALLCDAGGRQAVRQATRTVVDWRGQIVSMTDRAYLTSLIPVCVVWGSDDMVIPATHADVARDEAPGAEVHIFDGAGHFPHKDQPARFVEVLSSFMEREPAGAYHRGRWRALMRRGGDAPIAVVPPVDQDAAASS